jgi:tetratricopeptide (TPR) repeat protein
MYIKILRFAILLWLATNPMMARADDVTDCFSIGNKNYTDPNLYAGSEQACSRLIAVRTGRSLAAAYSARGSWRHLQKNYDAALQDYDRALSLDPTNVEIYDYRADSLLAKGDVDSAIATYDKAIGIDPTYAAARYSRGLAYQTKGAVDRARVDYQAAIALPKARASFGQKEDRIQEWAQRNAAAHLKALDESAPGK